MGGMAGRGYLPTRVRTRLLRASLSSSFSRRQSTSSKNPKIRSSFAAFGGMPRLFR
jgi:hypothetical protein